MLESSDRGTWLQGRDVQGQARAAQKTIEEFAASYRVPADDLSQVRGGEGGRAASRDDSARGEEQAQDGGATVVSLENAVRRPVQTARAAVAGAAPRERSSSHTRTRANRRATRARTRARGGRSKSSAI